MSLGSFVENTSKSLGWPLSASILLSIFIGYQRELTFQHNDGSFSAFGERDEPGSMWLDMAFINRSISNSILV